MRLRLTVRALVATVALCSTALALVCNPASEEHLAKSFEKADAVFTGRLVTMERCNSPSDSSMHAWRSTYAVSRVWKSSVRSTIVVREVGDACSAFGGPIYNGPCEVWVTDNRQRPGTERVDMLLVAYRSPQGLAALGCDWCSSINGPASRFRVFLDARPSRTPR